MCRYRRIADAGNETGAYIFRVNIRHKRHYMSIEERIRVQKDTADVAGTIIRGAPARRPNKPYGSARRDGRC